MTTALTLQVALYPKRHIQASARPQDPLSWNGDLLAVGIYSDSLHVKGLSPCLFSIPPLQHQPSSACRQVLAGHLVM